MSRLHWVNSSHLIVTPPSRLRSDTRSEGGESVIASRSSRETRDERTEKESLLLSQSDGGFRLASRAGGSRVRSLHLGMWNFEWRAESVKIFTSLSEAS